MNNLPKSLQRLIEFIQIEKNMSPAQAAKLLQQADIDEQELMPWADFDHPIADSYGRKLVYDGGHFEIMVMSWVDGDMSALHDHGYTQWGAVQVFGPAEHAIFKIEDDILITCAREVFEPRRVVPVNHDLIHQMGNVGNEPYLTLHLYGTYAHNGGVTADARLYDLDEDTIQFTSGGVFFDLPESKINRRVAGPRADFPTKLRCKVELLKRLIRKNDSLAKREFGDEREEHIAGELFAPETWRDLEYEMTLLEKQEESVQSRYRDILDQEIRATAKLQLELLKAGLISDKMLPQSLKTFLSENSDSEELAHVYLELALSEEEFTTL